MYSIYLDLFIKHYVSWKIYNNNIFKTDFNIYGKLTLNFIKKHTFIKLYNKFVHHHGLLFIWYFIVLQKLLFANVYYIFEFIMYYIKKFPKPKVLAVHPKYNEMVFQLLSH